jgi:F1F0 ATPase subunit 2
VSDWLALVLALVAGFGLGLFYFGGLWLTVRRIPTTRHPALLTLGSFVGRTLLTLAGFYLVMDGRWERLALCLLGFLAARTVLVRKWGPIARK